MNNLTKERIETSIEKYIKILSELKKKNSAKTTQIEDLNNQIISFTKELSTEKEKILECEKLKEELKIKEKTLEERNIFFENEIKKLNDLTNIKTYTMEELDELLKSEELDESASEFSKFSEFSELKEQTETDLDIQYKTYKSKLNKIEEILNKLINENLKTELLLKIVKYINKDSLVNIIDDKVSIIKYINEIITEVDKKSKLPAMDDKEKQKYKDVLILLENLITFINNIKPKLIPIEPLTPQISRQLQPGLQRKAQPHKTQIEQEQIEKEKETSNMVSI